MYTDEEGDSDKKAHYIVLQMPGVSSRSSIKATVNDGVLSIHVVVPTGMEDIGKVYTEVHPDTGPSGVSGSLKYDYHLPSGSVQDVKQMIWEVVPKRKPAEGKDISPATAPPSLAGLLRITIPQKEKEPEEIPLSF